MSQKDLIRAIQTSDASAWDRLVSSPDATLEAGTLKGFHVDAIRLHTADCSNTEWEACMFDGTHFDGLNLQGAFFNGCTFHGCTFENCILAEASFDGCVLQKTRLSKAEDLEGFELTNSQFKECELSDLEFLDSTLESLSFSGGLLKSISGSADLKSVVLRTVSVDGFDTSEMTLSNCTGSGCTALPKGFKACEGRRCRV